jgi:hypothetical protein
MHGTGQGEGSIWRGRRLAGIAILTAVLVGCATTQLGTPRVMQPDDFKMLKGSWVGDTDIQGAVSENIVGEIQDNGAFYIAPRGKSGTQTPGMMRIVDGGVVYESPQSKGKMTFHESDSQWVWKWDGTTPDGRYVRNQLTKSK